MDVASAAAALFSREGRVDPYQLYRKLRDASPVLPLTDNLLLVTGYAECSQVLRDSSFLVLDAAWRDSGGDPGWRQHVAKSIFASSMVCRNGPDHQRLRPLLSRAFTTGRIAALRPAIERVTGKLLAGLAERATGGAAVDFMTEFAGRLPINVIGALIGIPPADLEWVRPLVDDLTTVVEPEVTGEPLAAANTAAVRLRDYVADLVADRGRPDTDDLLGALLAGHRANPDQRAIAEADQPDVLIADLILLLVAGHETSKNLLGNGLRILLDRPELVTALRADPRQVNGVVEEMLRYDAPLQLIVRRASRDTRVGAHRMPRHGYARLFLGAANRDPARFIDPDTFRPDRPDNRPLSFGAGPHFCVGAALGRLGATVAFPALLRRFDRIGLAGEPVRRDSLTLRGYAHLPVHLGARAHAEREPA